MPGFKAPAAKEAPTPKAPKKAESSSSGPDLDPRSVALPGETRSCRQQPGLRGRARRAAPWRTRLRPAAAAAAARAGHGAALPLEPRCRPRALPDSPTPHPHPTRTTGALARTVGGYFAITKLDDGFADFVYNTSVRVSRGGQDRAWGEQAAGWARGSGPGLQRGCWGWRLVEGWVSSRGQQQQQQQQQLALACLAADPPPSRPPLPPSPPAAAGLQPVRRL